MNVKSIVVEQIDWNATSKSLTLEANPNKQLWVAFPSDYDEPRNGPFFFQHSSYDKRFNKGFAKCQTRRINKNNFKEINGEFVYKASWQNILTERNSVSYYALYLPQSAVPTNIILSDPFTKGKQYRRTVFKDEDQQRYIIYLQCRSKFGSFSFNIICHFKMDDHSFNNSSYTDEFQQDFYARPEEWENLLENNQKEKVKQYFTNNNNFTTNNNYKKMGDKYKITQAGAVGPNSVANNNVFNQISYSLPDTTDYKLLASEIATLKQSLIGKATLPEHYTALAELTIAEDATKVNDGNQVVKSLLTAGKWVLDGAKDIGTSVVAEIINKHING